LGQYLKAIIIFVYISLFFTACSSANAKRDKLLSPYPIFNDGFYQERTIKLVKEKKANND